MINLDLNLWQLFVLQACALLSSELILRLPLRTYAKYLNNLTVRIFKVLRSMRISDHWKEKAMPLYAMRLVFISLILPFLLFLALAPLGLGMWVVTDNMDSWFILALNPLFISAVTACSLLYLSMRVRFHE